MGFLGLAVQVQQAVLCLCYLGFCASYDVVLFFVELGQTSLEVGTLVFKGLRQHVIVFVV
jgi:hypothetical protein